MKITFNGKNLDNKNVAIFAGLGLIFTIVLIYLLVHFIYTINEPEIPDPSDLNSNTLMERITVSKYEYCDKIQNPIGANSFKCYRYSQKEQKWIFYKNF